MWLVGGIGLQLAEMTKDEVLDVEASGMKNEDQGKSISVLLGWRGDKSRSKR